MRKKKDEVGEALNELAMEIAKKLKEDINISDKLDGFKALTAYYLGMQKKKSKETDDDDESMDFGKTKKRINQIGKVN